MTAFLVALKKSWWIAVVVVAALLWQGAVTIFPSLPNPFSW